MITNRRAADYLVGSFTGPRGIGRGLTHLRIDADGALRTRALDTGRQLRSPAFLSCVPHAAGVDVYAIEADAGAVSALRWIPGSPRAVEIGRLQVGAGPCHVAVDPATGLGVVSSYGSGTVSAFRRVPDGTMRELAVAGRPQEPDARPSRAHAALIGPTSVITTDLGRDRLDVWRTTSSGLRWTSSIGVPAGTGPRHLVRVSADRILVVGEHTGDVIALRDLGEELVLDGRWSTGETPGVDRAASEIARRARDGLVVVALRQTGSLALLRATRRQVQTIGSVPSGGSWPRHLLIDGDRLLVAHERSHDVTVHELDSDGTARPVARAAVPSASCVVRVPSPARAPAGPDMDR